jgi:hypothetical protein
MTSKVLAGVLVTGGVVFAMRGGCVSGGGKAPDEKLAGHFSELCEIARANISSPEKGVRKLGGYLDKHTGDMFGEWGSTLAAIERITNDDKHDDRARLARDRIGKPLVRCERDWMRFFEAVEADPKASELVDDFAIRLNRTLEIIFSSAEFDLRRLPAQLGRVVGALGTDDPRATQ